MDQVLRQAFLASAVLPTERIGAMGIINVIKTLSHSVGPLIIGRLARAGKFWVAVVVAGCLEILYDVFLFFVFRGYRTVEDKAQAEVDRDEGEQREEGMGEHPGAS